MKKNNLKVAFLIADKHDGKGGLENVLIDISKGLSRENIDSYIAMIEAPVYTDILDRHPNIKVFSTSENLSLKKKKPTFFYRLLWKYKNRTVLKNFFHSLKEYQPDALILINFPEKFIRHYSLFANYKNNNPKVAILAWPHGSLSILGKKISTMLKSRISIFDNIFAISAGIQNELKEIYHIEKSTLIYNPIKKSDIIPRRSNHFIYIGRIDAPEKRVKSLLKILSQLHGEWKLDLYGPLGSQETEKEIKYYVQTLGITDNLHFHGWIDNPWDQIPQTSALLLNSSSEGLPLVLIEAMMRGIPCIASDCPTGPREIIQDNINGWLYPPDQEDKCRRILQEILDEKRILPPQDQIQKSVEKFSDEIVIKKFINTLKLQINNKNL